MTAHPAPAVSPSAMPTAPVQPFTALHSARVPERDSAMPTEAEMAVPFLVYGTLRSSQGNAYLIERHGGRHVATTELTGYQMYASPYGFPYVIEADGSVDNHEVTIVCEVVEAPADEAGRLSLRSSLRSSLDALEGYVVGREYNHYSRVATRFLDPRDGILRWGWLYVAQREDVEGLPRIPSGDWVQHTKWGR